MSVNRRRSIQRLWLAAAMGCTGGVFAQASSSGAITVDDLVRLRQAELQDELNKRIKKLQPPAAPPPVAAAPVKSIASPLLVAAPPPAPPPTKRVAAIYGRVGSEVADIELPSGQLRRVAAGDLVEGWKVLAVSALGVQVRGFPWRAPQQAAGTRSQAGRNAKALEPVQESIEVKLNVPLGGTFQ